MKATESKDYVSVFGHMFPGAISRTMEWKGVYFMDNLEIHENIAGFYFIPRIHIRREHLRYMLAHGTWDGLVNREGFVDKMVDVMWQAAGTNSNIQVIACIGYGSYDKVEIGDFENPTTITTRTYVREAHRMPINCKLPILVVTEHNVCMYFTFPGEKRYTDYFDLYNRTKQLCYGTIQDKVYEGIGEIAQGARYPEIHRLYSSTSYDAELLTQDCAWNTFSHHTPSDNKCDVSYEFLDMLDYTTDGGMVVVFDDWDYIFYQKNGGTFYNVRLFREFARYRYRISDEIAVWFLQPHDAEHAIGGEVDPEDMPYTVTVVTMPLIEFLKAYFPVYWNLLNDMSIRKNGCLELLGADDLIDEIHADKDLENRFYSKASEAAWDKHGE